jgi:hypothetical protein
MISEQATIISQNSIKWWVSMLETNYVLWLEGSEICASVSTPPPPCMPFKSARYSSRIYTWKYLYTTNLYKFQNKQEILGRTFPWYDTDRIENDASSNSIIACSLPRKRLPSRCLATTRGIQIEATDIWEGFMKYAVRRWDGLRCHDIHNQVFIKIGSGVQKLMRGGHRHAHNKVIS